MGNKRSNPAPLKRIQLDLTPVMRQRLETLRDETDAASMSETIKRALALYDRVHQESKKGRSLGLLEVQNGVNVFTEIIILT